MEGGPLQTLETQPGAEVERPDPPRIYVASLSDYNAGLLHGRWIDAAQPAEQLRADIDAMLSDAPAAGAEEWAVFDFTGFYGVNVGEWADLEWVSQIASGIAEHGEAFAWWAQIAGTDEVRLERFDEAYRGEWDSVEDYVEHLVADFGIEATLDASLPDSLRPYVKLDTRALARDWTLARSISAHATAAGRVFIYDCTI